MIHDKLLHNPLFSDRMGRYFTESEKTDKIEIFKVNPEEIQKMKRKSRFKNPKTNGIKYRKGKQAKGSDPFPGRKPVDPEKVEEHSRGEKMDVTKVKTKFKQRELERKEKQIAFAAEQAARTEILLSEEAGFLEGDDVHQFTGQIKQQEIKRAVDPESAAKSFDLNLQAFGPYKMSYTRQV